MSRDTSIAERHRKQMRNTLKSFLKLRVGVYCKAFLNHDLLYHLIRWHDRWEIECREDVVSLDLHHHEPKEAVRLLTLQLTYFSGIPGWSSWSSIFYWNEIHKMEWFWFVISFLYFQILSSLSPFFPFQILSTLRSYWERMTPRELPGDDWYDYIIKLMLQCLLSDTRLSFSFFFGLMFFRISFNPVHLELANLNTGRVNAKLYGFLTWRLLDGFVPNYMTLSNWLLLLRGFFIHYDSIHMFLPFRRLEFESRYLSKFRCADYKATGEGINQVDRGEWSNNMDPTGCNWPKTLELLKKNEWKKQELTLRRDELKRSPWQMLLLLLSIWALRWTFLLREVDKRF